MYRASKFLVLILITLYSTSARAENEPADHHKFVFSVADRQRNFTGTLISTKIVVSAPNLSHHTVICPFTFSNRTLCKKPAALHEVSKELTFIELKRPKTEPKLFTGNVSEADCYEVRAGGEPKQVKVAGENNFVDCLRRECGYLEPIVCDGKLAGLVAKMEEYNTNLFVPIEYLRKEVSKYEKA